jgi:hypothetical protein
MQLDFKHSHQPYLGILGIFLEKKGDYLEQYLDPLSGRTMAEIQTIKTYPYPLRQT